MNFTKNGAEYIQQTINTAKADGTNKAVITGNYEIEKTVLIPSAFYLVLENCHLRMADNTFCNMFTNKNCRTEIGRTVEGTDRNIIIEGRGNVILDGGEYNGLSEFNCNKDGRPHMTVNNVILFTNVDGFKISGLHIRNQRWWAMNFVFCCNGRINDIDFLADYTKIDENGNRTPYLIKDSDYKSVYVKNADGIDLRAGCHDIIIENITGFTEDDTIAITGLYGTTEKLFSVEGLSTDIHNIIIRNVVSTAFCAIVRMLNQSGIKLYNVLVDGVMDTSKNSKYCDIGGTGVRLGDVYLYGTRHATADETYNITVRNVYSRAQAVMRIAGAMSNCVFENICAFDGCETVIEDNASVDISGFIR